MLAKSMQSSCQVSLYMRRPMISTLIILKYEHFVSKNIISCLVIIITLNVGWHHMLSHCIHIMLNHLIDFGDVHKMLYIYKIITRTKMAQMSWIKLKIIARFSSFVFFRKFASKSGCAIRTVKTRLKDIYCVCAKLDR